MVATRSPPQFRPRRRVPATSDSHEPSGPLGGMLKSGLGRKSCKTRALKMNQYALFYIDWVSIGILVVYWTYMGRILGSKWTFFKIAAGWGKLRPDCGKLHPSCTYVFCNPAAPMSRIWRTTPHSCVKRVYGPEFRIFIMLLLQKRLAAGSHKSPWWQHVKGFCEKRCWQNKSWAF